MKFNEVMLSEYNTDERAYVDKFLFDISNIDNDVLNIKTNILYDNSILDSITNFFDSLVSENKILSYHINSESIFFKVVNQDVKKLISDITYFFRRNGVFPYCSSCGNEAKGLFRADNSEEVFNLCNDCSNNFSSTNTETETYNNYNSTNYPPREQKKGNYFLGFLGAFAGAIIGTIPWIIIGRLNFIASIAGVAIAFCSIKGYEFMGGKKTPSAAVVISMFCVVALFFANYIDYCISFYEAFKDMGVSFVEILANAFSLIIYEPDIREGFLKSFFIGLIFLVLGARGPIRSFMYDSRL